MRKMMTAIAVALAAAGAYAQSPQVQVWGDGAEPVATADLSVGTRIRFENGVTVVNGELMKNVPWNRVQRITFTGVSGTNDPVTARGTLRLRENPVRDAIRVTGVAAPAPLAVYSIAGTRWISIPQWNGDDVDATMLPAGVYLLRVNNQTIKFVKK